ncbi:flowering time control protein FPA-like [Dorcoceras hygrometricum]|uniref:Flowering time control protein FPA-like n=2 Tax=Dorcoceras hygrometricum TaxID=472368 RepID=A0A2Z7BEN6_9LAMI|nr:flowering time control protein FPA-like [Dorcoceras hygrometricum]
MGMARPLTFGLPFATAWVVDVKCGESFVLTSYRVAGYFAPTGLVRPLTFGLTFATAWVVDVNFLPVVSMLRIAFHTDIFPSFQCLCCLRLFHVVIFVLFLCMLRRICLFWTGVSLFFYIPGKKIDLTEVRALQNGAGRRPMKAPWVRPPRRRVGPDSRDAPRRMGSPRSSDRRSSPQPRKRPVADGKSTSDRRKELGPKSGDVPRQSGDDGAQKNLKRSREVENGTPHNASGGGHLFVEGVNCRDRAGSFWDMGDPDLGWNMGRTLIGDHDVLHLLSQPAESLTHALAWNACQVLSLASTFQLREERSRNSESKLREEIAMLREELLKKQKESEEKSRSCETLRVELEEKSKSYDVLRQELQQLEDKYSVELTTGERFLDSALGKTLLTSTGEKAVEGYRASSAFRDEVLQQALTIHDQVVIDCRRQLRETKLVSEEIVRMIEPSVPEPGDENNDKLLGTLDEILGDIDDDEMIEALRQNLI